MITAANISLAYGTQVLFKEVNIKFTPGNCYGIIGANGAGKSTFLKILSGEIEADTGDIIITPGERLAILKQDHFAFNDYSVVETVIMGYPRLWEVMTQRDQIYSKEEFTEEDGLIAAELEGEFAELGGWEAEAEAGVLLSGLGLTDNLLSLKMSEIEDNLKVRVLLAQALFGNPDILLLDEPTNHLDWNSIRWLENFLAEFRNTVIVVSHDRHFLNTVCTHIADIDFGKIELYVGNYDFWYLSSQLAQKQARDLKKRREDKIAELKEFIQRFSSNLSKARQATSRKKLIDKLTIDDIRPSSRRFPYVAFKGEREVGRNILEVKNLTKIVDGVKVLDNFSLTVNREDKIAFVGPNHAAKTLFFEIIMGNIEADSGSYEWGVTTKQSYFPKDNSHYFDQNLTIIEWLSQFSQEKDETFLRSFLGRMLFSGDEALKVCHVLSGGERVRCVLSRMMLEQGNVLILDEPTNHLDLEAISSLNNGLIDFTGVVLFNSHDHQFVETIANRIVEFGPAGEVIDRIMGFEEYLESDLVKQQKALFSLKEGA
ncbi:MAG: ABC-F family ATP-binding cassette domain-containing protein [Sphaerochaetaceae bacterium]|jgi:ATPase subunit of ABC transporter with duplicated ATPase domains|nr:ATP-binding cassette domain-containing protein [Sphaerochaetaceae bacterium]HHU88939.1 ATP-binding cassette domain-containing protein [Spirochaetales bacterium]